ncbi:MAG: ion transporter [Gammaproteobacteria bacterium]
MVSFCKSIADAKWFQNFILAIILLTAASEGLQTYPAILNRHVDFFDAIDKIILGIFVVEIAIRIVAYGSRFWRFFSDGWNVFDFLVVVACLLPIGAQFSLVLRLVRVLRVLRLVTRLPRLQVIVGTLIRSFPSMGYVALLLALHFYIYAVMGVSVFGLNDPVHFGSLQRAMVALFSVVTLEGWVDLMRIQMFGSAAYGYEAYSTLPHGPWVSSARPYAAVAYFITFIMFGTMIILNLLIGIIMNGMQEAEVEREESAREEHIAETGKTAVDDEINLAERHLAELKTQLEIIRRRVNEPAAPT